MNKRKVVIIVIIIFIIILLTVGIYFVVRSKPKTESDADIYAKGEETPPIPGGPPTSSGGSLVNNEFPLKKGMRGTLVSNVQSKLSSNPTCLNSLKIAGASVPTADGVFGPITEKALKTCFGVTQVSKELYDSMMKAQPTTTSNTAPAVVIPMGGKIVAYDAKASGVNTYKTKNPTMANLFKYYPNGSNIGTFLAKDGIFSKVIASEDNTVVWVMTSQIKYIK